MMAKYTPVLLRHGYRIVAEMEPRAYYLYFRVLSTKYNHLFVAKVLDTFMAEDPYIMEEFDKEVKVLMTACHPNVIQLYDRFKDSGTYCMILEDCENGSLAEFLDNEKAVDQPFVVYLCQQIISTLLYLHDLHIAYRVNPTDILITKYNKVKFCNFDGCYVKKEKVDSVRPSRFSLYYAPEVYFSRSYNPYSADIWSCGVLLYRIVYGMLPWDVSHRDQFAKVLQVGMVNYPRTTDPKLIKMIQGMLHGQVVSRYDDARIKKSRLMREVASRPPPVCEAVEAESSPLRKTKSHLPVTIAMQLNEPPRREVRKQLTYRGFRETFFSSPSSSM